MTDRFAARATAFGLALIMTLAVLGSLDFLATTESGGPSAVMAAASQPRA